MLEVKIKKLHKDAVIPTYAKEGDAGMDLTAVSCRYDKDGNICYDVGLAFEIPDNHVGLLFPRSSLSKKHLSLANHVGVIDSGYRGSVVFKFKPSQAFVNYGATDYMDLEHIATDSLYDVGERIGQIIILPYPKVSFVEVDELSETERGHGGFGSTDKVLELVEKLILSTPKKFVNEGGSMRYVLKGDIKTKLGELK
jgi:dUTP pyrophosphatase